MTRRIALTLTLLVTSLAVVAGLLPPPAAASPARATSAAQWLAAQAPDGHLSSVGTTPDIGLTLDGMIGLVAAGAPAADVNRFNNAIRAGARAYAAPGEIVFAGRMAKLLLGASLTGSDVANYAGMNLRTQTLATVGSDGRVTDRGTTSQANVFDQSLAIVALARTGSVPGNTVNFLATQQCAAGYFRIYYTDGQTCDQAGGLADRDATAMAIMALRAAKAKGNIRAELPLARAIGWLVEDQRSSGGYIGGDFMPSENANSTGLAAAALSGLNPDALERARSWASGLQLTSGADSGAIAHTRADRNGTSGTIPAAQRGTWVRATAQGLLALNPVDFYSADKAVPTAVDVYTMPGSYTVNGRQWRASCEPYSQTLRCTTEIWGTRNERSGGGFRSTTGWMFNNLTYLPASRSLWAGNTLSVPATRQNPHVINGRRWSTECDTSRTGRGACRSEIFVANVVRARQLSNGTWQYYVTNDWEFNNMVRFSN